MLINLSNHPSEYWREKQIRMAQERWGEVIDLTFPTIAPEEQTCKIKELASEYCKQCISMLCTAECDRSAVHLMGEMVFSCHLVNLLKAEGITVVASTAERNVHYVGEMKEVTFNFVTFREY